MEKRGDLLHLPASEDSASRALRQQTPQRRGLCGMQMHDLMILAPLGSFLRVLRMRVAEEAVKMI